MAEGKAEMLGMSKGDGRQTRERIPYDPAVMQAWQGMIT